MSAYCADCRSDLGVDGVCYLCAVEELVDVVVDLYVIVKDRLPGYTAALNRAEAVMKRHAPQKKEGS